MASLVLAADTSGTPPRGGPSKGGGVKRLPSFASDSTRAPSSARSDRSTEQDLSPPAKRAAGCGIVARLNMGLPTRRMRRKMTPRDEAWQLCQVAHQVSLTGRGYDSKAERLGQMLQRLPADGSSGVLVLAAPASRQAVEGVLLKHEQQALATESAQVLIEMRVGRRPELQEGPTMFCTVINYDLPASGEEYLRRVGVASAAAALAGAGAPAVVHTMLTDAQFKGQALCEVRGLLERARRLALAEPLAGGAEKAAELDSVLGYFVGEDVEEEAEEEAEDDAEEEKCDCTFCQMGGTTTVAYHAAPPPRAQQRRLPLPRAPATQAARPGVEVVRIPLEALEDMAALEPLLAPRLDHVCTLICLHNMNTHNPWDGYEHLFALPPGRGAVRVVLVLAPGASWHDYPDYGAFCGGTAWMDILDMDGMDKTDRLLERLQEHELRLLGGEGERLLLMGCSQGGGQSLLRFVRSRQRLGGWMGSVCHVPTVPHTPRDRDPLTLPGRPLVNVDRPVHLLAGGLDTTFPAAMVQRDFDRLREVGGFTDVHVTVRPDLTHEGPDDWAAPPDLVYLRRLLPTLVPETAGKEACRPS